MIGLASRDEVAKHERVRLALGSGYRYQVGATLVLVVIVAGIVSSGWTTAAPGIVIPLGLVAAVAGVVTTGVFVEGDGELVVVTLRIVGICRWSQRSDPNQIKVGTAVVEPRWFHRSRTGVTAVTITGLTAGNHWIHRLRPEYGHAILTSLGIHRDDDYSNSITRTIRQVTAR